jgi:dTDP-L-rhamnose 4-epimerase
MVGGAGRHRHRRRRLDRDVLVSDVDAMRVLVTGGAGFIGSAIVDMLVDEGHDVIVADNLHPLAHRQKPDWLNERAEYRWIDLRDPEAVAETVRSVDVVCHQAAMVGLGVDFGDVADYVAHNDEGTAVLLRTLHERNFQGRIVLASSMVVYGEGRYVCQRHGPVRPAPRLPEKLASGYFEPPCPNCSASLTPEPIDEDAPVDPRNVYAATKLHQEHLCAAYAREHSSSWIALRYHNVYGPRMPQNSPYAGVASIFRSAAERGEAPQVYEDGGQLRDFIHVDDVARANLAAIVAPIGNDGPYNIATGHPHSVLEMATALTTAIGSSASSPVVVGGARLGDVRHVFASPERAATALGFRAAVLFGEGMARFAHERLRS